VSLHINVVLNLLFGFDGVVFVLKGNKGYGRWAKFVGLADYWGYFGLDESF
jgi:hypothetical protein